MENKIIKKIRVNKKRLLKLYKLIKDNVDFEKEMVDSDTLLMLQTISKIDEELTDIIYIILYNENS